jgi:hypothetical protein
MIIHIEGNQSNYGAACPNCGKNTTSFPRRTIGCAAVVWCLCLSLLFGVFGLVAFFIDSFMDV